MIKILTHYSDKPIEFDPNRKYDGIHYLRGMKPCGLWLSDDSDYGWREWCEGQEFRLSHLKVKTSFEVDLSKILILDSDDKIIEFSQEYNWSRFGPAEVFFHRYIKWQKVAERYSGILISPYSWGLRMESGFMWYYGWDCASACIWDLSTLRLRLPIE